MMDEYCERTELGLLAEPLNAFSNASFLIAAWAAWSLAQRTGKLTAEIRILIGLGASVGVGSILWHTSPNSTTLMLDIIPIVIFIVWFIWLYCRKVIGMRLINAAAAVGSFLTAAYFAVPYAGFLHGAPVYTPGLIVVWLLGLYHFAARKTERFLLPAAAGVYFAALFFRTIDQELCGFMPIGTHFIWHSLIGLVTYLAMRSLIVNYPAGDGAAVFAG